MLIFTKLALAFQLYNKTERKIKAQENAQIKFLYFFHF